MGGFGSASRQFSEQVGNIVMIKFVRLAALAAVATAAATPAAAQVSAAPPARAHVNVTKPLILEAVEDLQFGSVAVYGPGTITIPADGTAPSCGAPAEMTCNFTGAQRAEYTVRGSNNAIVTDTVTPSVLDGAVTGDTVDFRPLAQSTLQLNNAGSAGTTLYVGGEVDVDEATSEDAYAGDIEVTVEY
jgi:hypothetical protein